MAVGLSLRALIREIEARVDEGSRAALDALSADIFANRVSKADVQPRLCALVGRRIFKQAAMATAGPVNALSAQHAAAAAGGVGGAAVRSSASADGREPRLTDMRAVLIHASSCNVHDCTVARCAWARHKLAALERAGSSSSDAAAGADAPIGLLWRQLEAQLAGTQAFGAECDALSGPPADTATVAFNGHAPLRAPAPRAGTPPSAAEGGVDGGSPGRHAKRPRVRLAAGQPAELPVPSLGGLPAGVPAASYVLPAVAAWARVGARVQVRCKPRFGRPRQLSGTILEVEPASGEALLRYDLLRLPCSRPSPASTPLDRSAAQLALASIAEAADDAGEGEGEGGGGGGGGGGGAGRADGGASPLLTPRAAPGGPCRRPLSPRPPPQPACAEEEGVDVCLEEVWLQLVPSRLRPLPGADDDEFSGGAGAGAAAEAAALAKALMPPPPALPPLCVPAVAAWECEEEGLRGTHETRGLRTVGLVAFAPGSLVDVRPPGRGGQPCAPARVVRLLCAGALPSPRQAEPGAGREGGEGAHGGSEAERPTAGSQLAATAVTDATPSAALVSRPPRPPRLQLGKGAAVAAVTGAAVAAAAVAAASGAAAAAGGAAGCANGSGGDSLGSRADGGRLDPRRLWYEVELHGPEQLPKEALDGLSAWSRCADAPPGADEPRAAHRLLLVPWRALRVRCAVCERHQLSVQRTRRSCALCAASLQPPSHVAYYEYHPEVAEIIGAAREGLRTAGLGAGGAAGAAGAAGADAGAGAAGADGAAAPSEIKLCLPCKERLDKQAEATAAGTPGAEPPPSAQPPPSSQPPPPPPPLSPSGAAGGRRVVVCGMSVPLDDLWLCRTDARTDNSLVRCSGCGAWVHAVCALALPAVDSADGCAFPAPFHCAQCTLVRAKPSPLPRTPTLAEPLPLAHSASVSAFSIPLSPAMPPPSAGSPFHAGAAASAPGEAQPQPQPGGAERGAQAAQTPPPLRARHLPVCALSASLEAQLASELRALSIEPDGALLVRVLSNTDASNAAKRQMRRRKWSSGEKYPSTFPHTLNAILCVQQGQHTDVALFMLYAQEYGADCEQPNTNRVYISYVDSVRYLTLAHGQPPARGVRTAVYHALLTCYLANCRARGFGHVHIWVQPPRLGDEYLFLGRPAAELRPPNHEWLRAWYVQLLSAAQARGIVQRFGGMLDEFGGITSARQIPLFQGDHWDAFVPQMVGCASAAGAAVSSHSSEADATARTARAAHAPGGRAGGPATAASGARPPLAQPTHPPPARPTPTPPQPQPPPKPSASEQRQALSRGSAAALGGGGVAGTPMTKANSSALVAHAQRQMRRLQGHFLIATLAPAQPAAGAPAAAAPDDGPPAAAQPLAAGAPHTPPQPASLAAAPHAPPPAAAPAAAAGCEGEAGPAAGTLAGLSPQSALCRSRMHFVTHCRTHGLQFSTRRYAEYSTAMLVHALLRPQGTREVRHCLDRCLRDNIDDGSPMIECGRCHTWVHTCCVQMSLLAYRTAESYQCPSCTLRDMAAPAGALACASSDRAGAPAARGVGAHGRHGQDLRQGLLETLDDALGVELVRDLSDDWSVENTMDLEALGFDQI